MASTTESISTTNGQSNGTGPSNSQPQTQTQINLSGKIIASESTTYLVYDIVLTCTVTGANRGIGLGIATCCLDNGAEKVYSIDLSEPDDEFKEVSKRFDGRLLAITANVTQEETVIAAIDRIVAEAGALHGMVVNAGRTHHKAALDFTAEEIQNLFSINVSAVRSP